MGMLGSELSPFNRAFLLFMFDASLLSFVFVPFIAFFHLDLVCFGDHFSSSVHFLVSFFLPDSVVILTGLYEALRPFQNVLQGSLSTVSHRCTGGLLLLVNRAAKTGFFLRTIEYSGILDPGACHRLEPNPQVGLEVTHHLLWNSIQNVLEKPPPWQFLGLG